MDHPIESRGPQLVAVCVTFITLSTITLALRTFTRIRLVKQFGADDWAMIVAWLCYLIFITCALGGVRYGTGRHAWDLQPEDMMKAFRYWWVCYISYSFAMMGVKVSVGLTLLRLTNNPVHKMIVYTIMGLSAVASVVFCLVAAFQCHPVHLFWTQALGDKGGSCLAPIVLEGFTYGYSAVNCVTDFTFALLPIALVYDLQMDFRTKVMLVPILSMACIASSAIIARMAYVHEFSNPDFLWGTIDIAIWSCTEQGLAITAGSLATLRPLIRAMSTKLGMSRAASRAANTPAPPSNHSRKRSSRFGVVSFRGNETTDAYHRMDDFQTTTTPTTLTPTTLGKDDHNDIESGWGSDKPRSGGQDSAPSRWQIEKKIEIHSRVDPAYS